MSVEWQWRNDATGRPESERWTRYEDSNSTFLEASFHQERTAFNQGWAFLPAPASNGRLYKVDFNAMRQHQPDSFSNRRQVRRNVHLPLSADMLSASAIELQLAPPEHTWQYIKDIIGEIVPVIHAALQPARVQEGGSIKKRTCVWYSFDADLTVFLNDFDPTKMRSYQETVRHALTATFPPQAGVPQVFYQKAETFPHGVHLALRMLEIDLLITGIAAGLPVGSPHVHFYAPARSPEKDDFILQAKSEFNPLLHHLILAGKHWAKQAKLEHAGPMPKSCNLELLCAHVLRCSRGTGRELSSPREAFVEAMRYLISGKTVPDWFGSEIDIQPGGIRQNVLAAAQGILAKLMDPF